MNVNVADVEASQTAVDFISNDCVRQYSEGVLRSDRSRKHFSRIIYYY